MEYVWMQHPSVGTPVEVPATSVAYYQSKGWYTVAGPGNRPSPDVPVFVSPDDPAGVLTVAGVQFQPIAGGLLIHTRDGNGGNTVLDVVGEAASTAITSAQAAANTAAASATSAAASASVAETIAGLTGEDDAVALLLSDPTSATGAAVASPPAAGTWTVKTSVIARSLGWFVAHDYGSVDYTGAADSTTAVQAAINAAAVTRTSSRGSTVWIGPGMVSVTGLVMATGVTIKGVSRRGSRLNSPVGSVFAWSTTIQDCSWEDLHISTGASGSHVFDMGATGGLALSSIRNCYIVTSNPAASLWRQHNDAAYIDVTVENNNLDRPAASTVPGWDILNNVNQCVSSTWRRNRVHGHGTTAAPFFRIECINTGTWNYGLTFADITGEENGGGLIHLYGVNGAVIDGCNDFDFTGEYQGDIIKVASSGRGSYNVSIRNSARKNGTLAPTVYDINAADTLNRSVDIVGCEPAGNVAKLNISDYCTVRTMALTSMFNAGVAVTGGATAARTEYRAPVNVRASSSAAAFYVSQRFTSGHGLDVFLESAGATTSRLLRLGRTTDSFPRVEIDRAGKPMWGPGTVAATGGVCLPDGGALPTASVTYRGKLHVVEGAAGAADKLYMCMKSATDTYSWVQVATAP